MFDPHQIKNEFPILKNPVSGKQLVYLDNAATSQKPKAVIEAISEYYQTANANVHRGVHSLSDQSTRLWESSRQEIATFFGAESDELILTRNTTEALNGLAYGWGDQHLNAGDVIVTTLVEHHANSVPWQQLAARHQATFECVGITADAQLDLEHLESLFKKHGQKIKLITFAHVSNAVGSVAPVKKILELVAKYYSSESRPKVCIDGAQSAPHLPINFHELGVDFYAFSGHKMFGPMGIGGLLVKKPLLETEAMQPWLFGGGMIASVSCEKTTFNESISERFTAGTPDVASAVGLAAACRYLKNVSMTAVAAHDQELVQYAVEKLADCPAVTVVGPVTLDNGQLNRVGSVSFMYEGVHAHDVAQILDSEGVAVRSGHHCTMPLHTACNWQATIRASFAPYNTKEDIDALVTALNKVATVFNRSHV